MPTKNIELLRKYRREWYKRNQEHAKSKTKQRKSILKEWLAEKKATLACNRCNEDHPATLDFHHKDRTIKEFPISTCITHGWSISRIEKEIAKCEVLCSNCHRKLHYNEKNGTGEKNRTPTDAVLETAALPLSYTRNN